MPSSCTLPSPQARVRIDFDDCARRRVRCPRGGHVVVTWRWAVCRRAALAWPAPAPSSTTRPPPRTRSTHQPRRRCEQPRNPTGAEPERPATFARQQHLVREIAAHRRRRRTGRLAVGGSALVAGLAAIVVLVLAGPGTSDAFAAWTPSPTAPAPGQVASAESTCSAAAAAPPPGAPSGLATGPTQVSLVDTRGPFTLVLFGANTVTRGVRMCISGPSISPSAHHSTHMSESIGRQPPLPGADNPRPAPR
jgi:hypothetical protein